MCLLYYAGFVLTEGTSTASEAACLGVPTVYVNSTEPRGYLRMPESDFGLVRGFSEGKPGVNAAIEWLGELDPDSLEKLREKRDDLLKAHEDVVDYVIRVLESKKNHGTGCLHNYCV